MSHPVLRRALLLLCACVSVSLAACGGGGGGDGGSGGGGAGGGGTGGGGAGGGGTAMGNLSWQSLSATANFISLAPGFAQPASAQIFSNVTGTGTGTLYTVFTSSNPDVATLTSVSIIKGQGTAHVRPGSPSALGLGDHSATITVRVCVDDPTCATNEIPGSPKTVTVSVSVQGMTFSVPSLDFTVGNNATPVDLTKSILVGSNLPTGWTLSTDIPFLTMSPANGSATYYTPVNVTVDTALLDEYEGGEYTGYLRLSRTAQTSIEIPVHALITRTRVNHVAPYVAEPGRVDDVIIRGEYLQSAPPTGVLFGNVPATSFTVVSDTEIRATHPAMTAGDYTVHVSNAQGIDRTTARLHVHAATNYPAAAIDYPNGGPFIVNTLVYDAEREALLVGAQNDAGARIHRIMRYIRFNGGWLLSGSLQVEMPSAFALSADGRRLFVARRKSDGYFYVDECDPANFAVVRSTRVPEYIDEGYEIAVANDGRAVIRSDSVHLELYSPLRRSAARLATSVVESRAIAASGDGSLMLLDVPSAGVIQRYVSGSTPIAAYETTAPFHQFFALSINRRGTLFLKDNDTVTNASFVELGKLPATAINGVLSPEGARVYGFDGTSGNIRVFDSSLPSVGGFLAEVLPAITPIADPVNPNHRGQMLVTPDGRTLFIAGADRIVVQPLQ
jgi:hypothetical protein